MGFPVNVLNLARPSRSTYDNILRDGTNFPIGINSQTASSGAAPNGLQFTAGSSAANRAVSVPGGFVVYPGHSYLVTNITFKVTRNRSYVQNVGITSPETRQLIILISLGYDSGSTGGGYVPFTISRTIREDEVITAEIPLGAVVMRETESIAISVQRLNSGGNFDDVTKNEYNNQPFDVIGSVNGVIIADGFDQPYDYDVKFCGDSITQNSALSTYIKNQTWNGIAVKYFDKSGTLISPPKIARLLNVAKGSTTSTQFAYALQRGQYKQECVANFIMHGTNDILIGTSNGTVVDSTTINNIIASVSANMQVIYDEHMRVHGTTIPLIFIGSPPLGGSTSAGIAAEAALKTLREAMATKVTSLGGVVWNFGDGQKTKPANNTWFFSQGAINSVAGVYSASTDSNYVETSGFRTHPNIASNALMGARALSFLTTNHI